MLDLTPHHTATFFVALVALYLVVAWIMSRVFKLAGRPAWAAFVPVYNNWVLFEISGKPGWWVLFALIPYIGFLIYIVLYIIAMLELARRFGKSIMFAIFGLIIFAVIGFILLSTEQPKYRKPKL